MMETISTTVVFGTTAALATVATLYLAKYALYPPKKSVIPSPLKTTIPYLTPTEVEGLGYRPGMFPGGRDVETPYGSIRVYEWGPEDGRKVLFVHGISTSCMTLSKIAEGLVGMGYRVMLFDLFGRGFSDGIGDLPHDARLYTTQMLLALASSPLPWTGTNGLRLLGYSLGGGVAVHFANSFPHLVESLVLLAPAGLIRAESFGRSSRIIFKSGLVPDRILSYLTKQRLKKPIANSVQRIREPTPETDKQDEHDGSEGQANTPHIRQLRSESYLDVLTSEAADPPPGQEMTALEVTVLQYVSWMATHHDGFLSAFTSSIQHAPLTDQHEAWGKLGSREEGTTLVMIGRDDELIDPEYFHRDATDVLGEEGMRKVGWKVTRGGHDFVMTHSGEVLKEIKEFWGHGKRRE